MCTAFVHRGKDIIAGCNFDINEGAFKYDVFANESEFYVGIDIEEGLSGLDLSSFPPFLSFENNTRRIQGVNIRGQFAVCLNNLRFTKAPFSLAPGKYPIDQLVDDFIKGKKNLDDVVTIADTLDIVNLPAGSIDIPDLSMHVLATDPSGKIVMIEPGNGYSIIRDKYTALTNFSVLELPADLTAQSSGYYGLDRYNTAMNLLRGATEDFDVKDGLALLESTHQTGTWGTRVSFVYSRNENAVYYCREADFTSIIRHAF